MSASKRVVACADAARKLAAQVSLRWQAADPLLPAAKAPPGTAHCGADLVIADASGEPLAMATCEHWQCPADSLDLTWGAAHRFQLTALVAGPAIGNALDLLLARWRGHLADVAAAADDDSAAVVLWPSRDIEGVATLLQHGFAPRSVVAACQAPAPGSTVPADPAIVIRRAALADIDAVVYLGLEVIKFDAHFGGVIERPSTAGALRSEVGRLLAGSQPWIWLAERDGAPVAVLYAERPETTGWIAPLIASSPVAYLSLMGVQPGQRSRGLGAAMTAVYHSEVAAARVPVSLLHYEQTNPLSVPFWSQGGYRPLWTSWEARPASTIR